MNFFPFFSLPLSPLPFLCPSLLGSLLHSILPPSFLSLIWICRASEAIESPDLADLTQHYSYLLYPNIVITVIQTPYVSTKWSYSGEKINVHCGLINVHERLTFSIRKGVELCVRQPVLSVHGPECLPNPLFLCSDFSVTGLHLGSCSSFIHVSHAYRNLHCFRPKFTSLQLRHISLLLFP